MVRFLFQTLAAICLAIAVIFIILDATRSLGQSTLSMTPFKTSWQQVSPDTLTGFSLWLNEKTPAFVHETLLVNILQWPTFMLFTALSVIFYITGYRKKKRIGMFSKR